MRLQRSFVVTFLVAVLVSAAAAQPAQRRERPAAKPAAELAAMVAPFLDPQTVAVIHVDLAQFDLSTVLDFAAAEEIRRRDDNTDADVELSSDRPGPADVRERFQRGVEALRKEGVRDVFVVVSLADLRGAGPFVIVPSAKKGAVCPAMEQIWGAAEDRTCDERDGTVFYGYRTTWQRLSGGRSPARLPLEPALAAVADSGLKVAVPLSEEQRRVLREMAPQFPPELGGARGDDLAAIQWAAIGVSTKPEPRMRAVLRTSNAEAAAALNELAGAGLKMLGEMPPVRHAIPGFEGLVDVLTPRVDGERLVVSINREDDVAKVRRALARPLQHARAKAARSVRTNDLKQVGLAMHNFHDVHKSFPPSARYGGDERLLSWRVYVLPYLGEEKLYKQFRLDEPWDSEQNKKLIEKMPAVFAGGHPELGPQGKTTFLAPAGDGTIFSGKRGVAIREISDGTSNTILLVSVPPESAVIWTKPDDFEIDLDEPLRGLISEDDKGFFALFADGSVRFISREIDPETLRRLLIRNDGKPVGEIP